MNNFSEIELKVSGRTPSALSSEGSGRFFRLRH
jgi:hypothetical protein